MKKIDEREYLRRYWDEPVFILKGDGPDEYHIITDPVKIEAIDKKIAELQASGITDETMIGTELLKFINSQEYEG